jgi:hypothetical protein
MPHTENRESGITEGFFDSSGVSAYSTGALPPTAAAAVAAPDHLRKLRRESGVSMGDVMKRLLDIWADRPKDKGVGYPQAKGYFNIQ